MFISKSLRKLLKKITEFQKKLTLRHTKVGHNTNVLNKTVYNTKKYYYIFIIIIYF